MWKAPSRPLAEISQSYNDGVVTIYAETDGAEPGYQPVPTLTEKIVLRYEERRLGIQRYYQAMQNQVEIERVIRTQKVGNVTSQDVAVTECGKRYGIGMVQAVQNVYPPSQDITLTRIEQVTNEMV